MVGGDGGDAVFCVEPAAAVFGDSCVGAEEVFEGDAAEGDNDFGVDEAEFLVEPVEGADAAFFDGGGAVAFGAAFDYVGGMSVICRRGECPVDIWADGCMPIFSETRERGFIEQFVQNV